MEEIKKRVRKQKTEDEKTRDLIRKKTPSHVVEIELQVLPFQDVELRRTNEHLRVIRNTVLGVWLKNYKQMVRTKKHKRLLKQYIHISKEINSLNDKKTDKEKVTMLTKQKKEISKAFESLREQFQVTFEFGRKYVENLRKTKYSLPDAVSALSVCEMAWNSIEGLLFRNAEKVRFYKKTDTVTFQGKQAERCIILKQNKNENAFFVTYAGMQFPLLVKKDDLFIQETLANIGLYLRQGDEIDKENVERFKNEVRLLSTYRVRNNRIVCKEIRGKRRYFLQTVLEGNPVPKRKKNGTFRHTYGTGRLAGDIGTQSIAVVSEENVILKNFAERSRKTFLLERKVNLLQRRLDRSRRVTNRDNFDEKGRIKKGPKKWVFSKKYEKVKMRLKDLHRKAAVNRKYAHNEDVNQLRRLGDEFIVEQMSIKGLQKKAKDVTKNEKTGRFNRRKRYGKSILNRSPGYFLKQARYKFECTGGTFKEVNTWQFKASQYDHVLDDNNKKQLSKRWHRLPDGTNIQRDLYSAFLLFCAKANLLKPDKTLCDQHFVTFLNLHNECITEIKNNRKVVLNSGIKF